VDTWSNFTIGLKRNTETFFKGPTGAVNLLFRRWVRAVNDALWKDEEVTPIPPGQAIQSNAVQMARTASHLARRVRSVSRHFPGR
jgi:hypothetical protein